MVPSSDRVVRRIDSSWSNFIIRSYPLGTVLSSADEPFSACSREFLLRTVPVKSDPWATGNKIASPVY